MINKQISVDKFMRRIMKESGVGVPSGNFTADLMKKISAEAHNFHFAQKPVISSKVSILAITGICLMLAAAFIISLGSSPGVQNKPGFVDNLLNPVQDKLSPVFSHINSINFGSILSDPLIPVILGSAWLLFLLDYFIKKLMRTEK